ncbi:hypothetical protein ES703_43486 [subsurface metagenome]
MVLFDDIFYGSGKLQFFCQFHSFFDVVYDHECAHAGSEVFVNVRIAHFILDEILGSFGFSDVMVEGAGFGQHGVHLDFFGRFFCERCDEERMVV